MTYAILAVMAVMTAAGVWCAERWLRGRPVSTGLLFGIIGIIADFASFHSLTGYNVELSLADVPFISAALFFGPLPGVVAGLAVVFGQAMHPLLGLCGVSWLPVPTMIIAFLAVALRKWFFDGRRPFLIQGLMLGFVFEAMHLSFDVIFSWGTLARACEVVINAYLPESVGIAATLAVSCVVIGNTGSFRRSLRSRVTRILFVYVAVLCPTVAILLSCASGDCRSMVKGSLRRLNHLFDSQLDYMLHSDAVWEVERYLECRYTDPERLVRELDRNGYDELNVADTNGTVILSSEPKSVGANFGRYEKTRPYMKLLTDPDAYITEPFRRHAENPDLPVIKYVGVPLGDGTGFLQLGCCRSRLADEFEKYFFPMFNGMMNFFESDYNIIATTNGNRIALANGGHENLRGKTLDEIGIRPDRTRARIDGEWCRLGVMNVGEWSVYCVVPLVEAYGEYMIIAAFLHIVMLSMLFGFRVVMLRFRRQQAKIDKFRCEADERRRKDLDMASRIQSSSLPTGFPRSEGFSFFAMMRPAKEVGGDFYDCYKLDDGRIAFSVADVSGKGVPAAMFMMKAKGILKTSVSDSDDLAEAIATANDLLAENNEAEMFVTVWTGVFDPASRTVEYVNAGHNAPILRRADGSVMWLRKRCGSALAVFEGCKYGVERFTLEPGDSLLVYTDGVTEAQDANGGFYGEMRLEKTVALGGEFVTAVFADVAEFAGAAEQADDITAFALDVKP